MLIDSIWEWLALIGICLSLMYYFGGLEEGRVRESWNASIKLKHTLSNKELTDFNDKELKKIEWQKQISTLVLIICGFVLYIGF